MLFHQICEQAFGFSHIPSSPSPGAEMSGDEQVPHQFSVATMRIGRSLKGLPIVALTPGVVYTVYGLGMHKKEA